MIDQTYKIGVLGTGHLIQHVVPGLLRGVAATDILLSPRNTVRAKALQVRYGCAIAGNNAEIIERCETVLVAVRPFQVEEAIAGLPWRAGQTVLSFCAGVPIAAFVAHVNDATIVRALPVTAAEFGESPTCIFPGDPVAIDVLGHCGPILELNSEDEFEVASVMGAYYGWVQALIGDTAGWLTTAGLNPATARHLASAMTRAGATTVMERTETRTADLVEELCLPGSITGLGLESLSNDKAFIPWRNACAAVLKKLQAGFTNSI